MATPATPNNPAPKRTILGMFTVVGDMIMLSLGLLVLLLGIVTAGPAAAAAIDAREQISMSSPSTPFRTLFQGTARHFKTLWAIGPLAIIVGIAGWIGAAFWLVAPAPFGVIMLAVVLFVTATITMILLAIPSAADASIGLRTTITRAVHLVISRPLVSFVGIAAAAAALVLAYYFPTVGIVAISGALVEITWRAWGQRARETAKW
ncbi:hypothetical protein ACWPKO_26460 (plasmid) [Coraliomargarita sp. W4R53]